MLKIIGALLVIMACSGMGFYEGMELTKHEDVMKQIRQMVLLLKGEIRYGNSSLFDVFDSVAGKIEEMPGELLRRMAAEMRKADRRAFFEIFEQCVEEEKLCGRMTEKERSRFLEFGKGLGGFDRETQLAQMDLYLVELDRSLRELHEEVEEKKKLYRNLGVLGGFFLALMLW